MGTVHRKLCNRKRKKEKGERLKGKKTSKHLVRCKALNHAVRFDDFKNPPWLPRVEEKSEIIYMINQLRK